MIVGFTSPLVSALRLANSEFKPAMEYMYHAMLKAKELLKKFFNYKKAEYGPIMDIIHRRWNRQMGQRHHLAGYYFNPTFQYDPKSKVKSPAVMSTVFYVIEKLAIKSDDVEINLNKEFTLFENCCSNFGRPFLVKTFKSTSLGEWWSRFGCDTPNLKRIAIRILSQTCSSSGCERNWNVFERIPTKKRNRLEHQMLNGLVYVHCNVHVMDGRKTESLDPIGHEHVDVVEDWIVHDDEDPPLLDGNENDDMFKADETTFPIMESPRTDASGYPYRPDTMEMQLPTADQLCKNPLPLEYALGLIRKVKSDVTDEYMRSLPDLMVIRGRPHYTMVRTYLLSDLTWAGLMMWTSGGETHIRWACAYQRGGYNLQLLRISVHDNSAYTLP
uniref:HAT C-terminal dimerisation domain-containing protein n=1 Tax=Nelumbo nucifera TaxID=4432 RepID=A0A822Y1Q1_NELNU|nr:TPA_asm: hypothetical protein HUJ06_026469 [Nelumbo nucifera]